MSSKMMSGSPILRGDNTVPGIKMYREVAEVVPAIEAACRKMGLDYYPIVLEIVSYDEMSEIASYGGFPVRYPHWRFGMEYEELAQGYAHNQFRISEMVINTCPAIIYLMESNTLVDNVDVIAHAIGHIDFFKNNVFFQPTNENMMNKMANHSDRVRRYMARWGDEVVTEFIDHCLRIETLIDPAKAWRRRKITKPVIRDERHYEFPSRLHAGRDYMEDWVNSPDYLERQREEIRRREAAQYLDVFEGPEKDVFGFIKDHAPLKPWQQDVIAMLYDEAMYFSPQRGSKTANEGWASYCDNYILCREGLASLGQKSEDAGIVHFADHKMRVLGGHYSQNPYKLGFELLLHVEERWNKGRFGREWEECTDRYEREHWDRKLGLGLEKVLEIRKYYNDYSFLLEFFDEEFCRKQEYYERRRMQDGDVEIVSRDFKKIKKLLLQRYLNGGLPDIRLEDPNHLGKGWFLLQHHWDERPLHDQYARETLASLHWLWKETVVLATRTRDGIEYVYVCTGTKPDKDIHVLTREDYEKEFIK